LNKNIVLRTSNIQLIEVMLYRLINSNIKLTYIQFSTIINVIISLLTDNKL